MRRPPLLLLLPLVALALGACGAMSAMSATSAVGDDSWPADGPLATSMPTRTCVWNLPDEADLDPDDPLSSGEQTSMSCFDPSAYETANPCTSPPDLAEGQAWLCGERPALTQQVVDDWDAYADETDAASAQRLGQTLEEYRRDNP